MRIKGALRAGGAVLGVSAGIVAVTTVPGLAQTPTGRPYSAASPFNTPVGPSPAVLPDSATVVAQSLPGGKPSPLSTGRMEANNYDHPVYRSRPSDPLVTLSVPGKAINGKRINVPAYAQAAGGSDGHLGIVAPDGYEYDLWQARRVDATTISARIAYRQKADGPGITTPQLQRRDRSYGGGVAAGWGLRAGMIRAAEMRAGRIDHALFVVISHGGPGFVYPSSASAGSGNPNGPKMGQRFWLDLSDAQIDATSAPAWEKTIAKAVHDYGAYFGDTGGNGFGFMLESSTPYVAAGVANPWDFYWPGQGVRKHPTWGYTATPSSTAIWSHLKAIAPPRP
jgi:hypothetical protein